MVKQFQKPKGNGGRQRKFVFCGKNYCFVSWFRENKPFRARIHFGSTYSIGTYSDLEKCLLAIAEFTREKVESTNGLEQRGWSQRDEKALAQLQGYVKNEMEEAEEIQNHFDAKKGEKALAQLQGYVKNEMEVKKLSVPLRKKLMKKLSPSIPPISMKLEYEVPPIILGEEIKDYSFLFDSYTIKSCEDRFYNPHSNVATSPALSPTLSMDILEPPCISPLSEIHDNKFRFANVNNVNYRSYNPKKLAPKRRFKIKLRGHAITEPAAWWQI